MKRNLLSSFFKRSETFDPIHPRDPALSVLFGGGQGTSSGVLISEETAQTITAVYAAVNIISETIAMLPWNLNEREGEGKKLAVDDPRFTLIHDQPNRWQNSFEFRELVISQLLIRGRSVSEIIVNGTGVITDLMPLQPGTFLAFRAPDGTIAFQMTNPNGTRRVLLSDEVLDLRGHPDPRDPTQCISPIKANSETLGITRAADTYAGKFFGSGTVVSGVLETDGALSDNAYQRLKQWTERHQGVARSHNPAILEEGLKWHQTSLNADDAQLIETRKYQVEDVARIFRIPAYKLGAMDRATFNNVEQQAIDFATDTLAPKITKLEKATDRAILAPFERRKLSSEININGLLRGDSKARALFYKTMWSLGAYSPNRILQLENENPVEGGDRRYIPVNFVPTDKIDDMIGNNNTDPQRTEPFVRSIFDRIVTAQCKILERGGTNFPDSWIKHSAFITRNIKPLVDSFGESVTLWFDCYYKDTTDELNERKDEAVELVLDDWRESRVSIDVEKFYNDIGIKNEAS